MGREEGEWTIHEVHPTSHETRQAPEPGLDPVERRKDIQARNRDITTPNVRRRCGVGEPCALPEVVESRGQGAIRLGRLAENDDRAAPTLGPRQARATLSSRPMVASMPTTFIVQVHQLRLRSAAESTKEAPENIPELTTGRNAV